MQYAPRRTDNIAYLATLFSKSKKFRNLMAECAPLQESPAAGQEAARVLRNASPSDLPSF